MASIYKTVIATINNFNKLIDKINYEYQLYFNGMRRTPPMKERNELERAIRQLINFTYPPYVQFQLSRVAQKFNTYKGLWDKKMELFMEYGTADMVGAAIKRREAQSWDKKLSEDIKDMEKELKEALKMDEKVRKNGIKFDEYKKENVVEELSSRIVGEFKKTGKNVKEETVKKIVSKKLEEFKEKYKGKEMFINYELKDGKIKFKIKVKK